MPDVMTDVIPDVMPMCPLCLMFIELTDRTHRASHQAHYLQDMPIHIFL